MKGETRDQRRINYSFHLQGPQYPIIAFTHGVGKRKEVFVKQLKEFGKRANLLFYDMFGYGGSGKSSRPEDHTLENRVDDLNRVVDVAYDMMHFRWREVPKHLYLAGSSMGGQVVHRRAAKNDSDLTGVILECTALDMHEAWRWDWKRGLQLWARRPLFAGMALAQDLEARFRGEREHDCYGSECEPPFKWLWAYHQIMEQNGREGRRSHLANFTQMLGWDLEAINGDERIRVDTLLVASEKDPDISYDASMQLYDYLSETAPVRPRIRYADPVHCLFPKRPDFINPLVEDFVRDTGGYEEAPVERAA